MNYPPPNLWMVVQIDPKPEPSLVQVGSNLRVPADWTKERIVEFLKGWNGQIRT